MRKIKDVKFTMVFGLLALAALTFSLFPTLGLAATGCPGDQDCDGIPDTVEQPGGPGITLVGGQRVPPCTGAANENRHTCLDKNTPDLFVILVRANGCPGTSPTCTGDNVPLLPCGNLLSGKSNIPPKPYPVTDSGVNYDPWRLVEAPTAQGGLGITIHEIIATQVNTLREIPNISPKQKAVRITESLNACGTVALGSSDPGTPNTTGTATLYTQRIKNKIDQECNAAPNNCTDAITGESLRTDLYVNYIQSLLVHELGHVMALTKLWTPEYGGPHEVSGSGFIMEQKPVVKIISGSSGSVRWYLSNDYSPASQADVKLK